jgi:hypothetical protein
VQTKGLFGGAGSQGIDIRVIFKIKFKAMNINSFKNFPSKLNFF